MIAKLRAEAVPLAAQRSSIRTVLRSRVVLLLALAGFLVYFVGYGFFFWFPTMLQRQSQVSDLLVGVLGTIPYAAALVAMLVNGLHSDRRMERRWHAAVPCLLAVIGALGLMTHTQSLKVDVLLFTLVAMCVAFNPPFWAMSTTLLDSSTLPAAVGFINAVGSVAGFAGPFVLGYLSSRTGSFNAGMAVAAVAGIAACLILLSLPSTGLAALKPYAQIPVPDRSQPDS